jgi:hypothetical protein
LEKLDYRAIFAGKGKTENNINSDSRTIIFDSLDRQKRKRR